MNQLNNEIRIKTLNQASLKVVYYYTNENTGFHLNIIAQKYDMHKEEIYKKFAITVGDIILGFYKIEDTVPLLQQELEIDPRTAALLGADVLDFLAPLSDPNWQPPVKMGDDGYEDIPNDLPPKQLTSKTPSAPATAMSTRIPVSVPVNSAPVQPTQSTPTQQSQTMEPQPQYNSPSPTSPQPTQVSQPVTYQNESVRQSPVGNPAYQPPAQVPTPPVYSAQPAPDVPTQPAPPLTAAQRLYTQTPTEPVMPYQPYTQAPGTVYQQPASPTPFDAPQAQTPQPTNPQATSFHFEPVYQSSQDAIRQPLAPTPSYNPPAPYPPTPPQPPINQPRWGSG